MKRKQEIAVLGLIVNGKGEFLITLRNQPELPLAHLKWQIPGGGLEFGEEPLDCLRREIKEEVGVKVKVPQLLPVVASAIWKYQQEEVQVILLCYLCKIKSGRVKIDGGETLEAEWVKPHELKNLDCLPLTSKFIFAAKKYLEKSSEQKLIELVK